MLLPKLYQKYEAFQRRNNIDQSTHSIGKRGGFTLGNAYRLIHFSLFCFLKLYCSLTPQPVHIIDSEYIMHLETRFF